MTSGPIRPPRVFVSYSHDSPAHKDRILALCDRLRIDGIDADLDQYAGAPSEGWPRWTMRQIETADFVLVVCTETYRRRFDGTEEKGRGLGATWEGAVLTQVHYDADAASGKLVPVVFASEDEVHVPRVLRGMTRYDLSAEPGYEQLYRHLTDQPSTPRPGLGTVIALPPKARASDFPNDFPLPPHGVVGRKWWLWLAITGVLATVLAGHLSISPDRKAESRPPDSITPVPMHLLRGEILDAKTHLPLPRVLVSLPELSLQATTDDQGQYRFEVAVPAGAQVKLRATREGYEPVNADPPAGTDHLNTYRMWRNR